MIKHKFAPYTNCETCPKCWSGKCRQCPKHVAELKAYWQESENHIHQIALGVWRGSNPQEIRKDAVSRASKHLESYPVRKTSGDVLFEKYPSNLIPGQIYPLSSVRSERDMISIEDAGSNPAEGFPADSARSLLSDTGAGQIFFEPLTPTPTPCAHYNYSKQRHVNRGSISRHMRPPSGSVSITFPTLHPIQKLQSSKMTEVPQHIVENCGSSPLIRTI